MTTNSSYYSKRPTTEDFRLELLPPSLFRDASVLDIGCNEGWITCQIAQSKGARKVVGVDIDDTLIRDAWKRRRTVWSTQKPSRTSTDDKDTASHDEPSRKKRKVERNTDLENTDGELEESGLDPEYFPSSCEHMFGPLPIPPKGAADTAFPHNVVFHTADWVTSDIPEDIEGYDVVVAFSVSKWIHLNGGDEGLMRFFRRVYAVLNRGGAFVFEPQEWDGYHKAKRMDPLLKEIGNRLQLRPENFERILTKMGFSSPEHLGRPGEGGFKRPIDLYRKPL
ncbi:Bicoid-interacting protein 3-domain-containing protein [Irpex rosettiformis]|uniref:Bicoid-interacting protein 3-domain-containing protein n=1 Tax=Irpex rosettiformis TaxID=378272 RepID=A0ACB8U4F9_9APHY|nr:Bicoid-interacting protein 3-domain-containing protein [Irpex rosettiformis]